MKFAHTLGLVVTGLSISIQLTAADSTPDNKSAFASKFRTNSLEAIRDFSKSIDHPVEALPSTFRMQGSRPLPEAFKNFDTDNNQIITTQEMKRVIQEYMNGSSKTPSTELCQLIDFFFNQYK